MFIFLTIGEVFGLTNLKKQTPKKKPDWFVDETKYLNLSEVKKLRRFCKRIQEIGLKKHRDYLVRYWFMVELGLSCGLRVSEMANLTVSDLNIQNREPSLMVRNSKGGKTRRVHFSPAFKRTCVFFLNWKRVDGQPVDKDSFVLASKIGKHLSRRALQKAFKRCLEGAELNSKYGIHCLRHTYGTHLYKSSGYNLRLVQNLLGHSSIRTTQVYADLLSEDIRMAVKNLYK